MSVSLVGVGFLNANRGRRGNGNFLASLPWREGEGSSIKGSNIYYRRGDGGRVHQDFPLSTFPPPENPTLIILWWAQKILGVMWSISGWIDFLDGSLRPDWILQCQYVPTMSIPASYISVGWQLWEQRILRFKISPGKYLPSVHLSQNKLSLKV